MSGVATRLKMLRLWMRIFLGRSYGHRPQDIGQAFEPARLHGYFVDLTAKTRYAGSLDESGLPLTHVRGGEVHHPTVVLQFGLGHWDRSLVPGPGADEHRRQFLNVAEWAAASMDERGGWPVFPQLGIKTESPYSAMTQGLAISVLVRAWAANRSHSYLDQARMAARLMVEPIVTGGTSRAGHTGIVLEEGPLVPPNTVLNGWLFGLFGLHDLLLVHDFADPDLESTLADTVATLVRSLPAFDAGWWSHYDTAGHLASPFYHRLHVAQLAALELAFPAASEPARAVRIRWQRSLKSPIQRTRAVIRKAAQQLSEPPVRF